MGAATDRLLALSRAKVKGYTRSDGVRVRAHTRGVPKMRVELVNADTLRTGDLIVDDKVIHRVASRSVVGPSVILGLEDQQGGHKVERVSRKTKIKKIILGALTAIVGFGIAGSIAAQWQEAIDHQPHPTMNPYTATADDADEDNWSGPLIRSATFQPEKPPKVTVRKRT